MPARFEKCSDGVVRFTHSCEICGVSNAPFGYGVNLLAAMKQRNAALAGKWFCEAHWPDRPKRTASETETSNEKSNR